MCVCVCLFCVCLGVEVKHAGCTRGQTVGAIMGGRGRGVAAFSFNVEALGITRGSMPEAMVGPRPLFPVSTKY